MVNWAPLIGTYLLTQRDKSACLFTVLLRSLQRKTSQNGRKLIEKSGLSHLRSFVIVIRSA